MGRISVLIMAFPSSIDTITTTPAGSDVLNTGSHTSIHTQIKTLLEAIQAKLGINGSAVTTSIDYILKNVTGGHDHDGTDSKKVHVSNLDASTLNANEILKVNSLSTAIQTTGKSFGTLNASKIVVTDGTGNVLQSSSLGVPSSEIVGISDTQTLNNKVYDNPVIQDWGGWIRKDQTWNYASATTITVTGDQTAVFQIGDKVRLVNSTTKYFFITAISYSAPNTTITLNAGTDYSLTNTTISDVYISRGENALGFPTMFNYTLTWTAASSNPSIGNGSTVFRGRLTGKIFEYEIKLKAGSSTTFGTGTWRFALPFTPAEIATYEYPVLGYVSITDSMTATYAAMAYYDPVGQLQINITGGANVANSTTPMTWTINDSLSIFGSYLTNL